MFMRKNPPSLIAAIGLAALFAVGLMAAGALAAQTPLAGGTIPKYVDPLPHFAGTYTPPGGAAPLTRVDGTKRLTISMEEFQQQVLPASVYTGLTPPFDAGTYVWGYKIDDGDQAYGPLYPSYTIEAQRGRATIATYVNNLEMPDGSPPLLQQYLTVDQTIHWANPLGLAMDDPARMNPYTGPVPAVVHLHGAEVPSHSDGHPDAWFTPRFVYKGPAWAQGASNVSWYPNRQEGTTLWFHDHTLGATRLNVFAGLAGFYFLRDMRDTGLPGNPAGNPGGLPDGGLPAGPYEIEVLIQDRSFDTNGQLYFPNLGLNPEHPFWLPEFFGDVIVVNGKAWPYLDVEPRRYRLRLLNGSNARVYALRLQDAVTLANGPAIFQVGTDGGLMDYPARLAYPRLLFLAPGERADVIVDFGALPKGTGPEFLLMNEANAPYPSGTPVDAATTAQIMKFRINQPLQSVDNSYNPANGGRIRYPMVRLADSVNGRINVTPTVKRQLTLNEIEGPNGPLMVVVNNTPWSGVAHGGTMPMGPPVVTEAPQVGTTEQWEIINMTMDAHPIHLHLVEFQLINRQIFNLPAYRAAYASAFPGGGLNPTTGLPYPPRFIMPGYGPPGAVATAPGAPINVAGYLTRNLDGAVGGNPWVSPYLQGDILLPRPNEVGWKDTVLMYPGMVTRIAVRFAPQHIAANSAQAGVNYYAFDPSFGPGYVWHCHILDHEDNEMMRPYKVSFSPVPVQ